MNGAVLDAFSTSLSDRGLVVDPFAGGGTIGLAAIARGYRVYVQDINPWAAHGLQTMLGLPSSRELEAAAAGLGEAASATLAAAYSTLCADGTPGQLVHTFRVARGRCSGCDIESRLFPYAVLSLLARKERKRPEAYLACRNGHVFLGRADQISECCDCGAETAPDVIYTPRRTFTCPLCGHAERLQVKAQKAGLSWEVVLVERLTSDGRREFSPPSQAELAQSAETAWSEARDLGVIPEGRETSVLLRHGFKRWNDLYPRRQQAVTQALLDFAENLPVRMDVVKALSLAIIGTVEFAGHLSRWDRWYLKCNDATAGHRFNFSTFVPEPNVWGAGSVGRGTSQRRIRSFQRASDWLHERTRQDMVVQHLAATDHPAETPSDVTVVLGSSERMALRDRTADIVLTDPPYHDDVQYSELSMLFRTWANLPLDDLPGEAAVNNVTGMNMGTTAYEDLLGLIFQECRRVLKADGRLVFSYANRDPSAWVSLFSALDAAGFKAIAYMVVHSENETDYAKRNGRACTKDFVMELVPEDDRQVSQWRPPQPPEDEEAAFLQLVGGAFLRIGDPGSEWGTAFSDELRLADFLAAPDRST